MKIYALLTIAGVVLTSFVHAQEPQPGEKVGRYLLLSGTVSVFAKVRDRDGKVQVASEKVPVIIKIDTVTGQTWKLSIGAENEKAYQRWDIIDKD